MYSFWLMPEPEAAQGLSAEVGALAGRFATPVFTPHLTLAGDMTLDPETLSEWLTGFSGGCPPFVGTVVDAGAQEAYFTSLFLQIDAPEIEPLKDRVWTRIGRKNTSGFIPHVSLGYGIPAGAAKDQARDRLSERYVGTTIIFDRIALYLSAKEVPVKAWRPLATVGLKASV